MKIFKIHSNNTKVHTGYEIAERVLLSSAFLERLKDVKKYTYTSKTPEAVYQEFATLSDLFFKNYLPRVDVKEYNYSSKSVVATTGLKEDPKAIFVNMTNINRFPLEQYVANGAHEWTHSPFGFGHGSNYTQQTRWGRMMCKLRGDKEDKDFSVPYTFERIVLEIAKDKGLL